MERHAELIIYGPFINLPTRGRFVLPDFDLQPTVREEEIRTNRIGYQYGPPLLGNTSFFPTGPLGDAMVLRDKQLWFRDVQYVTDKVNKIEIPQAARALSTAGGIKNLSSYAILYDGMWKYSIPDGIAPGMLTNWTQDLLFSMERLSNNPYVVKRVHPDDPNLPFEVEEDSAKEITTMSLEELHQAGRLFVADHSIQAGYRTNPGRWTAACTAYFYIHPKSGDFLPLAIKTNIGKNLTYTPLDDSNDWLFAKMAFEMNDLFHGQNFHLAASHDVAEPVHQAALRTMSSKHPVRGFLDRLMYQAYAVRPIGDEVLFNDGGFFDSSFAMNNRAGRQFAADMYPISAGLFRSSQFRPDLLRRGLVNCTYGPQLKTMPFYETVEPMLVAIENFVTAYIESYYRSDELLTHDLEVQNWIVEANVGAKVLDFHPPLLVERTKLVNILSHMAFLCGIGHHVLNAATLGESAGVLPLHPSAFNLPLPECKSCIDDIMPYLHNDTEALKQASLLVRFNRPLLEEWQGNLVNQWSDRNFLAATSDYVREAAAKFQHTMESISDAIRAQAFDADGLAQGMPFIWRSVDPRKIPYYLCV
ncbi:putative lipoxygenase [Phaeosphaeriaceae sp. PMI808]|nr:putative lipoxygenase [Phaeosphaeriaceae sp. PMI808]